MKCIYLLILKHRHTNTHIDTNTDTHRQTCKLNNNQSLVSYKKEKKHPQINTSTPPCQKIIHGTIFQKIHRLLQAMLGKLIHLPCWRRALLSSECEMQMCVLFFCVRLSPALAAGWQDPGRVGGWLREGRIDISSGTAVALVSAQLISPGNAGVSEFRQEGKIKRLNKCDHGKLSAVVITPGRCTRFTTNISNTSLSSSLHNLAKVLQSVSLIVGGWGQV